MKKKKKSTNYYEINLQFLIYAERKYLRGIFPTDHILLIHRVLFIVINLYLYRYQIIKI